MMLLSTRQSRLRLVCLTLLLIGILIGPVRTALAAASSVAAAPGEMAGDVACFRSASTASTVAAKPMRRSTQENIENTLLIPVRRPLAASITVNTTADEMTDNSTCSLREAIIAANSNSNAHEPHCKAGSNTSTDTITLASGATYSLTQDGTFEDNGEFGDLDIHDNIANLDLILKAGGSGATISQDAPTDDRVIHIVDLDASAEFRNLTITGGVEDIGGGVYNDGTLVLDDVAINGNAANILGGGLYTCMTAAVIQNGSVISNNSAPDGAGVYVDGGLVIDNSTISDNIASNAGGGIYAFASAITVIQNEAVISNNEALHGGGIWNDGELTIDFSEVIANEADDTTGEGGGLYNSSTATATIQNISAIGHIGAGNTASIGGGIHNTGILTIDFSGAIGNDANQGGGIWSDSALTVQNGAFVSNNTAGVGGGILNSGTGGVTINASTVSGNTVVGGDGGGILSSGTLTIHNGSEITGNTSDEHGGGVYGGGTITINDTTFSGNSATQAGGAIHVSSGTVNVTDSAFTNNTSTGNGDAVYSDHSVASSLQVNGNCIAGNGDVAVYNNQVVSQDFTENWWGASNGPTHSGNPAGIGDSASDNIDYSGFLTSEGGLCIENLMVNGSFETDAEPDLRPDDWVTKKIVIGPTADGIDTTEQTDGAQSFRFAGNGGGSKLIQDVLISGSASDDLTLTYETMSVNANGSGGYMVSAKIFYSNGSKKTFKSKPLTGSNNWTEYTITIDATRSYNKIQVQIQYTKKQGFVWFDNFVLSQD
jgi:CSLREA domain-containing protein